MQKWKDIVTLFYYSGAGIVLLGTGIRFLYKFFRGLLRGLVEEVVEQKLQSINPSHPSGENGQD